MDGIQDVFPYTVFTVFGIPIQDVVVHTWIIMAVLVSLAFVAGRNLRKRPTRWQAALEMGYEYIVNLINQRVGRHIDGLFELLTTLMLFVLVANLLGLIPVLRAPTRSLNTTAALSIVSFLAAQYFGVQERGAVRYARSFIEPLGCMLPLNILGQVSRTVAMALRLFGNVVAGEIVGEVMFRLLPLLAPIPFNLLGSITGVLQALVFTFLTVVFIADAVGKEEEEEVGTLESEEEPMR